MAIYSPVHGPVQLYMALYSPMTLQYITSDRAMTVRCGTVPGGGQVYPGAVH